MLSGGPGAQGMPCPRTPETPSRRFRTPSAGAARCCLPADPGLATAPCDHCSGSHARHRPAMRTLTQRSRTVLAGAGVSFGAVGSPGASGRYAPAPLISAMVPAAVAPRRRPGEPDGRTTPETSLTRAPNDGPSQEPRSLCRSGAGRIPRHDPIKCSALALRASTWAEPSRTWTITRPCRRPRLAGIASPR